MVAPTLAIARRRLPDLVLFVVTSVELAVLLRLTPDLSPVDGIYVLQHVIVLGIAVTRREALAVDRSASTALAVAVSCTYPYAQVIWLRWTGGHVTWPEVGFGLVALATCLSLTSLLALGRLFGYRPALRDLATTGPYALVRHPMYLGYLIGDLGYTLGEANLGTVALVLIGWLSLVWRIVAEERVLAGDARWEAYRGSVLWRVIPGVW
jgi:protein-S-isoprenylcysteine O-methyltransferase Ste14